MLGNKSLNKLHALRGFCAFYVVVFHAKIILWSGGSLFLEKFPRINWSLADYIYFSADMLSSAGQEMVIIFFVLSGFFIRHAQLKRVRTALQFYVNRLLRIYPPFLFSITLSGVVLAYVAAFHHEVMDPMSSRALNQSLELAWQDMDLKKIGILRSIFFIRLDNSYFGYNEAYWSLLPEVIFYFLVPFIFAKIRSYYWISLILYIAGLIMQVSGLGIHPVISYPLIYNCYFAVGVGFYDFVKSNEVYIEKINNMNKILILLITVIIFGLIIVFAVLQEKIYSWPLAGVLAIWLMSILLSKNTSENNVLINVFSRIGIFSFSLYLYHYPILIIAYVYMVYFTNEIFVYDRYYWFVLPIVLFVCKMLYRITEKKAVEYFRKI
ncbi:hypothetical protein CDA63_19230 [Hymenobacter amundsenii]|uniref:Acyltransferase 3 domain-containing protein n=1 Tax=Hymenobacter amundsenii TaxID=2006685 RepID=A0A246FG16_9BACT|nr:acyltransferase [Hymenobacter amundsenii]OWP61480.1 hypothetical protein CDA63_19230 [Hymenobacter amundsenii]